VTIDDMIVRECVSFAAENDDATILCHQSAWQALQWGKRVPLLNGSLAAWSSLQTAPSRPLAVLLAYLQTTISFRSEMTSNWITASHPGAIKDSLTATPPGQNDWNRCTTTARLETPLTSLQQRARTRFYRMNYRSKETMRWPRRSMRRTNECVCSAAAAAFGEFCLSTSQLNVATRHINDSTVSLSAQYRAISRPQTTVVCIQAYHLLTAAWFVAGLAYW